MRFFNHIFRYPVIRMYASRTFAIVASWAMLALGAALLPAQQQPDAAIDPVRIMEARYEVAGPWWDPARGTPLAPSKDFDDPSGQLRLLNKSGEVQTKGHPFFTPLGSNGRSCVTCHQPTSAMSLSLDLIRLRWADTNGKDPLFAAVDGSNCPDLPQDKEESHSLLLERGLFRIALRWPPVTASGQLFKPDFRIEVVRDPTGCNKKPASISVYRRPRVAANLQYIALPTGGTLMADGRERTLQSQATSAALTHGQASAAPTRAQLQQIEDFERQLFMAQQWDVLGGLLAEPGGPPLLGADNLASGVAGAGAVPAGGNLAAGFDPWRNLSAANLAIRQRAFRESVLRGVDLFASREFGLPDGKQGTCATCHRPGINHSIDIGTTNLPTAKESPELPLFRITCDASAPPHPQLGRTFLTQDPGRALITGKCADVGSILMQQLRGLTARAPYFANGSAGHLTELVDFFDRRFKIGLTDKEKQDLVNFLSIL
jgi:cytochrome c peroxidase